VLKLPRQRVVALVASGEGVPFENGQGRAMKEWVALAPSAALDWLPLERKALVFVGSTPTHVELENRDAHPAMCRSLIGATTALSPRAISPSGWDATG